MSVCVSLVCIKADTGDIACEHTFKLHAYCSLVTDSETSYIKQDCQVKVPIFSHL